MSGDYWEEEKKFDVPEYGEDNPGRELAEYYDEIDLNGEFDDRGGYLSDEAWDDVLAYLG